MSETSEYPKLTETKYGFDYGTARVERIFSSDTYGVVLRVASTRFPDRYVDVRVTPAGTKVEPAEVAPNE